MAADRRRRQWAPGARTSSGAGGPRARRPEMIDEGEPASRRDAWRASCLSRAPTCICCDRTPIRRRTHARVGRFRARRLRHWPEIGPNHARGRAGRARPMGRQILTADSRAGPEMVDIGRRRPGPVAAIWRGASGEVVISAFGARKQEMSRDGRDNLRAGGGAPAAPRAGCVIGGAKCARAPPLFWAPGCGRRAPGGGRRAPGCRRPTEGGRPRARARPSSGRRPAPPAGATL